MKAMLSLRDIRFGYPEHPILKSISFSANSGELLALMGVNGSGKSTLLEIIASLREPDSGDVLLRDRNLRKWPGRERARQISHLPQGTTRQLPFTVEQMVLMGRYAYADRWFESKEDRAYAQDAMHRMDCLAFRNRPFSTLSGGEQQRVLLAACVAQCPSMMLFDEPSTYLDLDQQLRCFTVLSELAREGALCIAVTHDLNLALSYCSRLLVLHGGTIAADFTPAEAARNTEWLSLLSSRLEMSKSPDGRPWVLYR